MDHLKNDDDDDDDDEWPCPICRSMQDKSRDLPRNFFAEQAMVHLQNTLSSNARTESEQTVQIEQEFQKLR